MGYHAKIELTSSSVSSSKHDDALPLLKTQLRLHETLAITKSQLKQLKRYYDDYSTLYDTLGKLPEKVSHKIMVPFGPFAFFPGSIIHTNEVMVLLGENYFAERSVMQSQDIIKRRQEYLSENIKKVSSQVEALKTRIDLTRQLTTGITEKEKEGVVEIREEYHSDEEREGKQRKKEHKKTVEPKPKSKKESKEQEDEDIERTRYLLRLMELEEEEERLMSEEGPNYKLREEAEESSEAGSDEEEEDEEEDEDEESFEAEEEEEKFDLQTEFEKLKEMRKKNRELRGKGMLESVNTNKVFVPINTPADIYEYVKSKPKEEKHVRFAPNVEDKPLTSITPLPHAKPAAPRPFSGDIVEKYR
jgi:unconventional prefoldin RPB5 interactor 1